MIHPRVALLATLVLLGASTGGNAALIFTANLTNSQEVPPVTPTLATGGPRPVSFGFATFMLNDAMTALSCTATIFNIDVTGTQTPGHERQPHRGAPPFGADRPPRLDRACRLGILWRAVQRQ